MRYPGINGAMGLGMIGKTGIRRRIGIKDPTPPLDIAYG